MHETSTVGRSSDDKQAFWDPSGKYEWTTGCFIGLQYTGIRCNRRNLTCVGNQHSLLRAFAICLPIGKALHVCHGRHARSEPHDGSIQTTVPARGKRDIRYTGDKSARYNNNTPRELDILLQAYPHVFSQLLPAVVTAYPH